MRGVSVIIRVRDERANLQRCLELLEAQRDVGETELIVVDAGSRDGIAQLARARGRQVVSTDPAAPFSYGGSGRLDVPCAERAAGAAGARALAHAWWSDTRWYESGLRARLSHRRAARLLGAHRGLRG
jgi:glycosyltransferase involved in cell wall biosynthesis